MLRHLVSVEQYTVLEIRGLGSKCSPISYSVDVLYSLTLKVLSCSKTTNRVSEWIEYVLNVCSSVCFLLTLSLVVQQVVACVAYVRTSTSCDGLLQRFIQTGDKHERQIMQTANYTLCSKKTCDHVFDDKLNCNCPFTTTFGTLILTDIFSFTPHLFRADT